eukprot:Rmarinus@m.26337
MWTYAATAGSRIPVEVALRDIYGSLVACQEHHLRALAVSNTSASSFWVDGAHPHCMGFVSFSSTQPMRAEFMMDDSVLGNGTLEVHPVSSDPSASGSSLVHDSTQCETGKTCLSLAVGDNDTVSLYVKDEYGNEVNSAVSEVCMYSLGFEWSYCTAAESGYLIQVGLPYVANATIHVIVGGLSVNGSGFVMASQPSALQEPSPLYTTLAYSNDSISCEFEALCGTYVAGSRISYDMFLRDAYGSTVHASNSSAFLLVDETVHWPVSSGSSVLHFSFAPTTQGYMWLDGYVGGVPLRSSGFCIVLAAAPADEVQLVHAEDRVDCKAGIVCATAVSGTPVVLDIQAFDVYGNRIDAASDSSGSSCVAEISSVVSATTTGCVPSYTNFFHWELSIQWTVNGSFAVDVAVGAAHTQTLVEVAASETDPSTSVVASSAPMLAVDTALKLEVHTVDKYGNYRSSLSSYRILAEVSSPEPEWTVMRSVGVGGVEVFDITPTVAGEWKITLMYHFDVVELFDLHVLPSVPDPETSEFMTRDSYGLTSCTFVSGDVIHVVVVLRDSFSNVADEDSAALLAGRIADTDLTFSIAADDMSLGATYDTTSAGTFAVHVWYEGNAIRAGVSTVHILARQSPSALRVSHGEHPCESMGACPPSGDATAGLGVGYIVEIVDVEGNAVSLDNLYVCDALSPVDSAECTMAARGFHLILTHSTSGDFPVDVSVEGSTWESTFSFVFAIDGSGDNESVQFSHVASFIAPLGCDGDKSCACEWGVVCGAPAPCQGGAAYSVYLRSDSGESISAAGVQAFFALEATDGAHQGESYVAVATQSGVDSLAVTLTPSAAGVYSAAVYFDSVSREISGSGFLVNITAAPAVPGFSAVLASTGDLCRNGSVCGPTVAVGERCVYFLSGMDACGNEFPADGFVVINNGSASFSTHWVEGQSEIEVTLHQAGTQWMEVYVGKVSPETVVGIFKINVSAGDAVATESSLQLFCASGRSDADACVIGSAGSDINIHLVSGDMYGNTPASPTDPFWATLSDTQSLWEVVLEADKATGWAFRFNSTVASVYSLVAEYKGATLSNGDVLVEVSPATASPSTSMVSLILPGEDSFICQALTPCGEVSAGSSVEVILIVRDRYGNLLDASVYSQFVLEITDSSGSFVASTTFDTDNWTVAVSLSVADRYDVTVTFDDIALSNCPFGLVVLPLPRLSQESMHATSDDLLLITAGANVTILVEGRDKFGNALLSGDAATAADFSLQITGRTGTIAATYTGEGAFYALSYTETTSGHFVLSLRYQEELVHPQSWTVTVVSGPPEASTSTVVLGYTECVWGQACGCATTIGDTYEYSLVLRDQFMNDVTGTPEVACSYVTSSLGVETETYIGIPQPGRVKIPFATKVAASYAVDVYLGGSAVSNSGFIATFLPRSGLNVNASNSFVTYADGGVVCESGAFCGPTYGNDSTTTTSTSTDDVRGCRAGETVTFKLFQVDSDMKIVNESSGLYVTAVAVDLYNVNDFLVLLWNAYADGTYEIVYNGVVAADWQLIVFLGSDIVVDGFLLRVLPSNPHGGTTQLTSGGILCLEGLHCSPEAQVSGTWGSSYEFVAYDAYGNQISSPLEPSDLVISGIDYLDMDFVDDGAGSVYFFLYVENAAEYAVRFKFDVDGSELLGSGLLHVVVAADAAGNSSSVVYCSDSCENRCSLEEPCPEDRLTAGDEIWYTVDLFDAFANPVVISEESDFPFGFKTCDDVEGTGWEACVSSVDTMPGYSDDFDRFVFSVVPVQAGMLWVSVVDASGADLRNSPFYIFVLAGPPSVEYSYVLDAETGKRCGFGEICLRTVVDTPIALLLVAVDDHGNEWSCSESECNYRTDQDAVLARFMIGTAELPWIEAKDDGMFRATTTNTEAGILAVAIHVLVLAEWVQLDVAFDLEVLPGPVSPAFSVVHACGKSSYSSHCDCRQGMSCRTVEAGNYFVMAVRFRDRYANAIEGTTGRRCSFLMPEPALNGTCAVGEDEDLLFAPDIFLAGSYETYVMVWDDSAGVSGAAVSNSGFFLTVDPSSFVPGVSQVYRMISSETFDLEAGELCVNETFCGEVIRPASDVYLFAVCLDQFGNRVWNVSGITVAVDAQDVEEDLYQGIGSAEMFNGEASLVFQLFTRGIYRVKPQVGDSSFGEPFLIECNTLDLELSFDLQVTVRNASDLEAVTTEVKESAAEALGVDVERMYVVDYSSSTRNEGIGRRQTELRGVDDDDPYMVSMMYKPTSREDLYQTEETVLHLDPANVIGEGFTTDDVKEPTQNEEEVIRQVSRDMSIVQYGGTGCRPQFLCPSYSVQAGTVASYEVYVSDAYGNPVAIEQPWFCRVEVRFDERDLCADASASCGCFADSSGAGVFAMTILFEELYGTNYKAGVYETSYEVSVYLDGYAIALSGWLVNAAPSNQTDVEASRLEGSDPALFLSATAGEPFLLEVTSRDKYSNIRKVYTDAWCANIVAGNFTATFPVSSNPYPGVFWIEPLLTMAGVYDLSLGLEGVLNATGWSVEVIPGATNASMCEVGIFGLDPQRRFVAGPPTASQRITIVTRDSFGNVQISNDVLSIYYLFLPSNFRGYLNQPGTAGSAGHYQFLYATTLEEVGSISVVVYLLTGGQVSVITTFEMNAICPANYVAVSPNYAGWKHEPNIPDYCIACPADGIDCNAPGQTISSLQHISGWWRASEGTLVMNECLNQKFSAGSPEACPGLEGVTACQPCMNISSWATGATDANPGGQCRRGYGGRLCALCEEGFSRSHYYDCIECPDLPTLVVGAFFYFFLQGGAILYQVHKQLSGDRFDYSPELVSMFTDFVQLFLAMKLIDVEGYDFEKQIEEAIRPVFFPAPFALDCVLHELGLHTNMYFHELRVMSFFPIVGAVLVPFCMWMFFKWPGNSSVDVFHDRAQGTLLQRKRFRELRGRSLRAVTNALLHAVSRKPLERPTDAAAQVPPAVGWTRKKVQSDAHLVRAPVVENASESLPVHLPPEVKHARLNSVLEGKRRIQRDARALVVPGLIIFLLYIHPSITAMTLKMYTCIGIENESGVRFYLKADVDIECYSPDHARGYLLGLVSLGVYVLGIPFLVLHILRAHRDRLHPPREVDVADRVADDVTAVAAAPFSPMVAMGLRSGRVRVCPFPSSKLRSIHKTLGCHMSAITSMTIAIDGAAGIFQPPPDLVSPRTSVRLLLPRPRLSTASRVLVTGCRDGDVWVWGLEVRGYPGRRFAHHEGGVTAVAAPSNLAIVLTAGEDGMLKCWDSRTQACLSAKSSESPITRLQICALTDRVLAVTRDGTIHVYSTPGLQCVWEVKDWPSSVTATAISRTGTLVAVSFSDGSTVVYKCGSQSPVSRLEGNPCAGLGFVDGLNGEALAFASEDAMGIWEFQRGFISRKIVLSSPIRYLLPPSDRSILSCVLESGELVMWNTFKESETARIRRYETFNRFGYLYMAYKPMFCWWSLVVILRKTAVVVAAVLLPTRSVELKALAVLGVNIIALIVHVCAMPYVKIDVNVTEFSETRNGVTVALVPKFQDILNTMATIELVGFIAYLSITVCLGHVYEPALHNLLQLSLVLITSMIVVAFLLTYAMLTRREYEEYVVEAHGFVKKSLSDARLRFSLFPETSRPENTCDVLT